MVVSLHSSFIIFTLTVYHSQGGYLPISKIHVTPLPDIFQKAATEIGLDTVDVNGEDMLGK